MEPRHGLEQRGELVAVAFIEKRRKCVESVGRDLLECVGSHGVLLWTGCPWFLRTLRNPTIRLEDTWLGHRHAEHRGDCHRACQRSVLARREAAGERLGVVVRGPTACGDGEPLRRRQERDETLNQAILLSAIRVDLGG